MKQLFLKLILPVLCFSACRYKEIDQAFPKKNEVKLGEKFSVNLPENHNQYENWVLQESNFKAIDFLNPVWHGNEKGIDFNFKGKAKGVDTLYFVLRKYTDTIDSKKIIVSVVE
jgi:hypothetical protein